MLRLPSRYALSAALGDEITLTHSGIRATLDITESLKGAPEDLAFVMPHFSCSVRLDLGVEYLLYIDASGVVSRCTAQTFDWRDPRQVALVRMLRRFEGRQPPGTTPIPGVEPRLIVISGSGRVARAAARRKAPADDERRFRPRPDTVDDSRIAAFAR